MKLEKWHISYDVPILIFHVNIPRNYCSFLQYNLFTNLFYGYSTETTIMLVYRSLKTEVCEAFVSIYISVFSQDLYFGEYQIIYI